MLRKKSKCNAIHFNFFIAYPGNKESSLFYLNQLLKEQTMVSWSKSNLIFPKNKSLSMAIVVFSLLCFNISASELVVHERGLSAAQRLGVLKMLKSKDDYFLLTNNGLCKVHKHDISPSLRKMNDDQLIQFLNGGNGVIKVGRFTNGEFTLDRHVRGIGGGPLLGSLFYALTKTACYGTAVAATGTVIVGTGGLAGAAASALTFGTTMGAGSAVGMTGAIIAGAGGTAMATEITTGVIMAGGGLAGTVAAIESASVMAYGLGTLVWFLP